MTETLDIRIAPQALAQIEEAAEWWERNRPVAHADTPTQPRIHLRYRPVVIRDAEIIHPASNVTREPVVHRDTPAPSGEFPDGMLEVGVGLVGPAQFRSSKGKTEEITIIGLDHPALLLVDGKFQLTGQETRDTGFDALPCTLASDQYAEIIG